MTTNQAHGSPAARGHLRGVPRAHGSDTFPLLAPAGEIAPKDGQNGQIIKNQGGRHATGAIIG